MYICGNPINIELGFLWRNTDRCISFWKSWQCLLQKPRKSGFLKLPFSLVQFLENLNIMWPKRQSGCCLLKLFFSVIFSNPFSHGWRQTLAVSFFLKWCSTPLLLFPFVSSPFTIGIGILSPSEWKLGKSFVFKECPRLAEAKLSLNTSIGKIWEDSIIESLLMRTCTHICDQK